MNTNQLKISIIIPVYNVEPYIADCIKSVMRQTYTGPLECIIVDDCGTDNSIEIAERLIAEYKGHIQFRILHHEHNRGLSAARNTGSDAATGEYIYYLDSDDYISDDCIEVLTQPLQDYEYDMVMGNYLPFGDNRRKIPDRTIPTVGFRCPQAIIREFYVSRHVFFMAWNKLIKRSLFIESDLLFEEGQLEEDELWAYKCCVCLKSMDMHNNVTYFYRQRSNSIMWQSKQNHKQHAKSHLISINYILSHPLDVEPRLWSAIVMHYVKLYLSMLIQLFDNSYPEYRSLCRRLELHPLKLWRQRKISLPELYRQFYLELPPVLGYIYLKLRKLRLLIFRNKRTPEIIEKHIK